MGLSRFVFFKADGPQPRRKSNATYENKLPLYFFNLDVLRPDRQDLVLLTPSSLSPRLDKRHCRSAHVFASREVQQPPVNLPSGQKTTTMRSSISFRLAGMPGTAEQSGWLERLAFREACAFGALYAILEISHGLRRLFFL